MSPKSLSPFIMLYYYVKIPAICVCVWIHLGIMLERETQIIFDGVILKAKMLLDPISISRILSIYIPRVFLFFFSLHILFYDEYHLSHHPTIAC